MYSVMPSIEQEISMPPPTPLSPQEPAPPAAPPPRLRLDYLDGLRGLAALYVVLHHAYYGLTAEAGLPPLVTWLTYWLYLGRSAVDIFIVLSGYCLMLPVVRSTTGRLSGGPLDFLRRRARRILPPFYAALGVSLLLIALVPALHDFSHPNALWNEALPAFTPDVIASHLLLVHNFDPRWHSRIDYPMWSVATEWQIYFLFPLLLLPLWRRFGSGVAVPAAFVVGLVPLLLFFDRFSGVSPHFLGLFALGMAAADLNFSPEPRLLLCRERLPWGWLAALLCAGLVMVSLKHSSWTLFVAVKDVLVGAATACLLVFCTRYLTRHHETATAQSPATRQRAPLVLRLLESRPAVALGVFSYSLYLIHAPVLAVCQSFVRPLAARSPTLALTLMLCLGVPLALGCSYLFHLAFERPFLSRTLKKAGKEIADPPRKQMPLLTLPQTKTRAADAPRFRHALALGFAVFGLALCGLIVVFYTYPDGVDSFFYSLDPLGLHQFRDRLDLDRLPRLPYRQFSRAYRLLLILLWGGYALTLLAGLRGARLAGRPLLAAILLVGVVTALFAPPLLSSDAYSNASHGRIFVLYGHNPYLWQPSGLIAVHDPIERYLVWDWPSVYGPVWTWIEIGIAALLRSAGVWPQVVAHKLFLAGALVVCALAGRRLAARFAPERANLTLLAIGLNPLLLLEGPATGHNDLVFVALLLVGAVLYFENKYVAAALCLGLSVGIKPITIFLLPWAMLDYSRGRTWRQTLTAALAASALVLLPLALSFIHLWAGPETLAAMHKRAAFDQHHASVVRVALALLYLGLSAWLWKRYAAGGWLTAWALFSAAMMFLLLVPVFPWYIIWFWPIFLLRWDRWHLGLSAACLALSLVFVTRYGMVSPGQPIQGRALINYGLDGSMTPERYDGATPER